MNRIVGGVLAGAVASYAVYTSPRIALHRLGRSLFRATTTVPRRDRLVLTFDDGPAPDGTVAVLDALDGLGARATFFLVGEQVERATDVAREIVARGHEVASHGYQHKKHRSLGPRETRADIVRSRDVIEDTCGVPVRSFRPPHGAFNLASWRVTGELGWNRVLWSREGRDWDMTTPEAIVRRSTQDLSGGEILLLHDSDTYSTRGCYRAMLSALPAIVARARAAGLEPTSLAEAYQTGAEGGQ